MFFPATHKSDTIAFSQNDHLPDSVTMNQKPPPQRSRWGHARVSTVTHQGELNTTLYNR